MEDKMFSETYSVAEFCAINNVKSIDVLKNRSTGKLFFSWGPREEKNTGIVGKSISGRDAKDMQSLTMDQCQIGLGKSLGGDDVYTLFVSGGAEEVFSFSI